MTRWLRLSGVVLFTACAHAESLDRPADQKPAVQQPVNEARQLSATDAQALAEFNQRVTEYAKLHQKLEATLPSLPKETTPQVIDTHQRALLKLMRSARGGAKQADVITQNTRHLFRRLLARVFSGKEGQELKATIMDDNPGTISLTVNSRYPDQVPLSTVPPQVLSSLPKLPEELEYRFIGERLILLDVHAHMIVDYMDDVFPR